MGTKARYVLTEAGYRVTDLMRSGVVDMDGRDHRGSRRSPNRPACPVCRRYVKLTPRGLVRAHRLSGRECSGTGRQVAHA